MSKALVTFRKKWKHENFESSGEETRFETGVWDTCKFEKFTKEFKTALTKDVKMFFPDFKVLRCFSNCFEISGFLSRADGKIFYFNIGDVRWNTFGNWDEEVLYRAAKDEKDYHGGINRRTGIDTLLENIATSRDSIGA